MTVALEREVERLAAHMAPIGGVATLTVGTRAAAHTRPAFYEPGPPQEAVHRIAKELSAHEEARYLPATLGIIDAAPLL